jgi:dipeptidyl aminopeptidase/acylaminoacyl peptidase
MDERTDQKRAGTPDRRAVAPYGAWRSPVTAKLIAEGGVGIMWPQSVGESLYWTELRPLEDGRYVVVRRAPDGAIADVTPEGISARTLVHEYGGGMYVAFRNEDGGESVLFSDQADQRLYRQDLRPAGDADPAGVDATTAAAAPAVWTPPRPVTPAPPSDRAHRYADGRVTPDGRLLVSVRERHEAGREVVNELVSLPTDGSAEPRVIASGHDFYAAPRIDADGRRVAWLCWDHPRMPWDGTELWMAELAGDGSVTGERLVAGGPDESVLQPLWSPTGALWFASDRTGWWNLYAVEADPVGGASGTSAGGRPEPCPLVTRAAEFASVPWVFGLQSYAFLSDGRLLVTFTEDGRDHMAVLDAPEAGAPAAGPAADSAAGPASDPSHDPVALRDLDSPFTVVASLTPLGSRAGVVAASHTEGWQVAVLDPDGGEAEVVRRGRHVPIDPAYISRPEPLVFPTEGGLTAHANYYPPENPDFAAPEGELPPLLVIVHGGPTSSHDAKLDLDVQYWTSRGIAVVAVNYGGSTGYGRAYRERLKGEWGVVDTVDAINAAKFLIGRGDADPARVGIRGGSAGGYTTLNALTRFDFFSAGASLFGLADLEAFATGGTHKFESQYLESMVGPYPERRDVYRERSPIHHVDDLSCPVILLQGLEDAIVPPHQAEIIVEALRRKGLPYAYLAFEGEQHGFRKAENIIRAEEAELYFYGRVWGFAPADQIEPVVIANLG